MKYRAFLLEMFDAAVAAARPEAALPPAIPPRPKGRTIVIGAGKGAAQLAQVLEQHWHGPLSGLVVTRYGYTAPTTHIEVVEAAHPVPDQAGFDAALRMQNLLADLTADDLVIALITGGGSALLPAPLPGLTLDDERALNHALLASGAPISAMNTIRKQFSAIKGGRLAQMAHPARVHTIVVSDVPGDTLSEIASGPTLPSAPCIADAQRLIDSYAIALPDKLRDFLDSAQESPAPTDPSFAQDTQRLIASSRLSLEAAADVARQAGWTPFILSDALEGEARHVGATLGDIAKNAAQTGEPFPRRSVLLSGGETTVSLCPTPGRGGPNSEFALALGLRIEGDYGIEALSADTDGIDGSEDNAGAFVDGTTCQRLRSAGLDPLALLARNSAYDAFAATGDLHAPGPTGTNVNDFRAILIPQTKRPSPMTTSPNKTAFVTGSSRGIGRAIAQALAHAGFDLALNDLHDSEDLNTLCDQITGVGRKCHKAVFDVSDLTAHAPALVAAEAALGPLTTLVNNAGVGVIERGDPLNASEASFDRCFAVNTKAAFFLTQTFAKTLLSQSRDPQGFYAIVNVTSSNATAVAVPRAEYCASKAAASMISKCFAARLGPEDIHVYDVQPGLIETPMTAAVIDSYQSRAQDGLCLLPRVGQADEVGQVVASLATGALPYTTGHVISVDGGMLVPRF